MENFNENSVPKIVVLGTYIVSMETISIKNH